MSLALLSMATTAIWAQGKSGQRTVQQRTQSRAQTPKADADVIVFKQRAVEELCLKYFDTNQDGKLSKQEAADVLVIPSGMFTRNKDITFFDELRFFTSLKRISASAFSECSNLQRLTLPEGIDALGERSFEDCTNLAVINIPSSVRHIGSFAFFGCKNLSCPIVIPEGVRELETLVFAQCEYLPSITLPSTLKRMDPHSVVGDEIHFKSSAPPIITGDGSKKLSVNGDAVIYVPKGRISAYKQWDGLRGFEGTILEE